jgi:hypothetical protein
MIKTNDGVKLSCIIVLQHKLMALKVPSHMYIYTYSGFASNMHSKLFYIEYEILLP